MTAPSIFENPLPGSVSQLAAAYRRALEAQGKSPRTIQTYLEALARLDSFLLRSDMPRLVSLLRRDHLEAFIADVQSHRSPATAVARYRALQSFVRWSEENGEIQGSPMAQMRPAPVSRTVTAAIPRDIVDRLLQACEGREFRDLRDMAIVRLFIDTGLRRNELATLRVKDLDLKARTATIPGRGGMVRTVQFTPTTARAIDRYLRIRRASRPNADSPALWLGHGGPMTGNGIYQAIEVRTARAGLERIHPHQFRQTFAHEQLRRDTQGLAGDEPVAAEPGSFREPVETAPLDAAGSSAPKHAPVSWSAVKPAPAAAWSSLVEPPSAVGPLSGASRRPRIDMSADLVHAMKLAAGRSRAETLDQVRAEGASVIDAIEAQSSIAVSEMRRRADDDIAGAENWATVEIARIRAEAERRAATRPGQFDGQLQRHLIESVRDGIAAFAASAGTSDRLAATAATGEADAAEPIGATNLHEAHTVAGHAPGVHSAARVSVAADRARGTARITTVVMPEGLLSLASIARFKRQLGGLTGVRWVSVSSNHDGTIQFEIAHDSTVYPRDLIPALEAFGPRAVRGDEAKVEFRVRGPGS